jgi:mycothiol synthase
MGLTPQLRMLRPTLAALPALTLPAGFALRSFQPGDEAHWDRVLSASFGGEPGRFNFDRMMRADAPFRPERVLFVVAGDSPVATASAWRSAGLDPEWGTVHYVAVVPEYQGHRLGYWVTLATLHRMVAEGLRAATLTTDDFRLPAIRTYLRLGFEPVLAHENQRERWAQVWRDLKLPELERRFAATLAGPVWQPPGAGAAGAAAAPG